MQSHRASASHEPAPAEPAPRTLKKYELLGPLAKGGMAELFLARAGGIGGFERLLVIKQILPELASDTEFVRMFLDEARTIATLHHSNIVHVYDVDMDGGSVFYAMEYLHGHPVTQLVERLRARGERVPLESALAIAIAVAAGLHYAHERWGPDGTPLHIVHRDVAPNNVIVTFDGNVKLIDFGIAKSAKNLSSTRFGLFKGKLPYAAPEQIRCEAVDRRTDVFSLGVLLYELTTGHPLFTADNEYDLMRVMTEAVVPLPRLRDKAYPRELEAIVLKALAKEPGARYPTAQALQRDLEVFASKSGLDVTGFSLARLMARLFDEELTGWRSAQRAGLTLEQHIVTKITAVVPVVPPPAAEVVAVAVAAAPAAPVRVVEASPRRGWRGRVVRGAAWVALGAGLVVAGAIGARWMGGAAPAKVGEAVPAKIEAAPVKIEAAPAPSAPAPAPAPAPSAPEAAPVPAEVAAVPTSIEDAPSATSSPLSSKKPVVRTRSPVRRPGKPPVRAASNKRAEPAPAASSAPPAMRSAPPSPPPMPTLEELDRVVPWAKSPR